MNVNPSDERAVEEAAEQGAVVVGVDGSAAAGRAVEYGLSEARRTGARMVLVHVAPDYLPLAAMRPMVPDDLRGAGRRLLAAAQRTATDLATDLEPDVRIDSHLLSGPTVRALCQVAARARLLVVGHETTSPIGRVFTGAITFGVASHAACPVVSVPENWQPDGVRARTVVGHPGTDDAGRLVEQAAAVAAERGTRLVLVHAWELPVGYDDLIVRRTREAEWNTAARDRIEAGLAGLRAAHPTLEVEVKVVHGQAAQALRGEAAPRDLLVLGRHGHGSSLLHLGGTSRALLREAACPVVVLPLGSGRD